MTFFESLVLLLAIAILLLQVSRRLSIPYPTMLAAAGVLLALVPGAPAIGLDPQTALVLFIAPVLVDEAFDFQVGSIRRLWRPLFSLAVVAVLLSAAAVAWLGVTMAGLPLFAAIALGAIVAPPDAAAATAVLQSVSMPRRSVVLLKGESLLNDASALLLFTAALAFQSHGSLDLEVGFHLAVAAPGGILLGFACAWLFSHFLRFFTGTLGGNLLEFVSCFGVWIIAEHLGLSAVLCLVTFAMTIAQSVGRVTPPRMRIHSFAVWGTTVFLLNVLAFLLMGLQARTIVLEMPMGRLQQAGWFAASVVLCLILIRMTWVIIYNRLAAHFAIFRGSYEPSTLRHGILVGWCGMRGLLTLATAFALPADFPQRDLIVLTAFAVVLATLVVQGLTLAPLVRLLKLDGEDDLDDELARVRADLASVALSSLDGQTGRVADHWRFAFEASRHAAQNSEGGDASLDEKRQLGFSALRLQRQRLETLRTEQRIGADAFLIIQEELDFTEVSLSSESDRHIEES
ncbi:sodium:proton antiporter [Azorhizobium oxalatiphilum]|uniref:Sodium:proton antiporter n=1 Tax=Azorhizobium oxalatiphilum TaxID=980631 RepID=A0A917FG84_9HYPH|nr:cation:proton antiporter [Azorhizobium oxalatiphilum]GGF82444.1 sodium:proton antiporter [Azorhizobium oxalatiphilum]